MRRCRLGRTGLLVSELATGLAFTAAQGEDVVDRGIRMALDSGVNYFDCAPYYSAGLDEQMLGNALRGVRDQVVLATKVGYTEYPDGHRSAAGLMRQLDESLQRLRTDHVDVVQIHEADFRKWWVEVPITAEEAMSPTAPLISDDETYDFAGAPVVRFLEDARRAGKARFAGVTGKDARQIARVVEALDVDTVMIAHQFNPVMRNAAEFLLPLTAQRDMGVLIAAPFMRGLLASPKYKWRAAPPVWADDKFLHAYFACVDIAEREGISLAELTIRWILGEQRKHTIVFGFRAAEEVAANAQAVALGPLPAALQEEIDALGIVHPLVFQGRTTL